MPTKVLIVLDGGYRFDNGATPAGTPDFTYATLVNTLVTAGMEVTKAHRELDSTATPGWQSFHFDAVPAGHSLAEFDAIWLIGLNGVSANGLGSGVSGALPDAEINAIAQYMDAGGGVFATGDHYSLGAEMCGKIPRVRAMRCWYGEFDTASAHMPASFPHNFPPLTAERADTTRPNPAGDYSGFPAPFIWFENQSDQVPQAIAHIAPTHPILRRGDTDILVFPDHMHEGNTLGEVAGYDYAQNSPYGDTTRHEFREISGHREKPRVIATGQVLANASRRATSPAGDFTFGNVGIPGADAVAASKTVNTLSTYDGRVAGVGRIVTGATFHHYVDINLNGDSSVTSAQAIARAGAASQDNRGFNDAPAVFDDIKAVFVNITNWLARPKPAIRLILERSTFSQGEAPSGTDFAGAVLVTVDGLKPSQFPGGPPVMGAIGSPASWVPQITVSGSPIAVEPTSVSTDDPGMPDRVQRFTFVYRVRFNGNAFTFPEDFRNIAVDATLPSGPVSATLTDSAFFQLVKSANPFMLDLADGNETSWLSSDIKVFRLIEGESVPGIAGASLPMGASRGQVLSFIRSLANTITNAQFTGLSGVQDDSALALNPRTTSTNRAVYNFALARVRLNSDMPDANDVRLFFRIFTTQTTAALTYRESAPGIPIEGYVQTAGANPVALPGKSGTEWISFPFFAADRAADPASQADTDNVKTILNTEDFKFFGALLDNNQNDGYPGLNPGAMSQPSIRSLLNGAHQCLVAQIEYGGTPIPNGATPWTSDKLSQRNIAMVTVANPGLDASRAASHTFEIEATPHSITDRIWPDELLLHWSDRTPDGTMLRIHIPGWNAHKVVELADKLYARHEIEAYDDDTIEMPGGGMRYIPLPQCLHRQTGVITIEFPLGIKKGQRFDLSVRQISNRGRGVRMPQPKLQAITLEEAAKLLDAVPATTRRGATTRENKGIFDLGNNRVLMTDLSAFELESDRAVIIEYPDPAVTEAAVAASRQWRETIGAFQIGVPVSTKREMLLDEMRLLSVMRWRLAHIERLSRWRKPLQYYVGLLADKVQALGGNPFEVPATPDGAIPQLPWMDGDGGTGSGGDDGGSGTGGVFDPNNPMTRGCLLGLFIALLLLIAIVAIFALWGMS
ncbi:MAG: hypothetical protein ACRCY3_03195 [Sphingorhabdus sp.]